MSLPPLPEPMGTVGIDLGRFDVGMERRFHYEDGYTASQMRAFAAAARLAALEEAARACENYGGAWNDAAQAFATEIRSLAIHVGGTCTDSGEK